MTFSWIVTCTNPNAEQKVRDSASFQNTKNKPALKLSRGILTADVNCTFNVTGSMSYDANIKSSVSVVIRALATPLDPYISGGEDCSMDLFLLLLSFLDVYLYFLSKNRFKREYLETGKYLCAFLPVNEYAHMEKKLRDQPREKENCSKFQGFLI